MDKNKKTRLYWRCNTPGLLKESLENMDASSRNGVLQKPFTILMHLLAELAETAIEVDDPRINCMMLRLGLYEHGIPNHPEFKKAQEYLDKYSRRTDGKAS